MHQKMFAISSPAYWSAIPAPWHFSALKDVEECPRRWALSSARYPDMWDSGGYPPVLNAKALAGQVIHAAVRAVTLAFAEAGCADVRDATGVKVLRSMGGFTAILHGAIDRVLDRQPTNPRVRERLDVLTSELLQSVPAMRQQIQQHLQRIKIVGRRSTTVGGSGTLGQGSYSELRLRADALNFAGIVDLLEIDGGQCTIWEFKTGSPDDRHVEQLLTYALLWTEDRSRNPDATPASRLLLSYGQNVKEIPPPDTHELLALRMQLQERILKAAASLAPTPPVARPHIDHCTFCGVRHLCPDYWAALPTWGHEGHQGWTDIEVRVGQSRGPRSWSAELLAAVGQVPRKRVVLVLAAASHSCALVPGMHLRLLNVRQQVDDGVTLIGISAFSEMFQISD
ncbi:MAG: PD-(D/E)XK nuclease family protein [Bryobacterales bacterium]|nr:PD-(D/E)XK nuclease family protein [Bryobacterales bacterium]